MNDTTAANREKVTRELDIEVMTNLKTRIDCGNYTLPTIPEASLRLVKLLTNPDSNSSEIERAIALDPMLAGQILKIANSCIAGALLEVTSLKAAFVRLGRKQIRSIVMMISIKSSLIQNKIFLAPMQKIWKASITCAFFGNYLAPKFTQIAKNFLPLAFLHNIGKLMILAILHEMMGRSSETLPPQLLEKIYNTHQEESVLEALNIETYC